MKQSLRLRLLLWVLCVVTPVTVGAGWLLTQVFGQRLGHDVDVAVQEEAETIAEVVSVAAAPNALNDLLTKISGETELGASKYVVVSRGDQVIAAAPRDARERIATGGKRLHMVRYVQPSSDLVVEIAVREAVARHATQRLTSILLLGVPVFVLLVGVGLWLVIGRELRPLEAAALQLDSIGADDLSTRLVSSGRVDEVGQVVRGVNAMLERVQRTMAEQRRFTADAAHALRTPVTVLRAGLEVANSRERSPQEYRATLAEALMASEHLSRVADRLLTLARLEAAESPRAVQSIDVAEMLRELADAFEARAAQQQVNVRVDVQRDLRVNGDPGDLYRLFYDLIDNALRYGCPAAANGAGEIVLSGKRANDRVCVAVRDVGPGIAPEDAAHVFERFYRGRARRSDEGGSGLGLSIARQIVRAHGGEIRIFNAESGGCIVEIVLPRAVVAP